MTALITGAARRVGRSIALALANRGYNIALHYNQSHKAALETKTEIEKHGVTCRLYPADLADIRKTLDLMPAVTADFPDLKLLINSASTFTRGNFRDIEPDFFKKHYTINFISPFFLIRDFARQAKSGQIINMLDTETAENHANYSVYLLAKKTLAEFTKMAALELAPEIRVNGIAPGHVLTPSNLDKAFEQRVRERTPLKQIGSPENITRTLDFLLDNEFVTGEIVVVDGGYRL